MSEMKDVKVRFGKYNWIIVESNAYGCLLLCDITEENKEFMQYWDRSCRFDEGQSVEWPDCELCNWCNDDFIKMAFSEIEAECILNKPERANNYISEQVGVFLLKQDILSYNKWGIDSADYFESDADPYEEKLAQPAIWIDLILSSELLPDWYEKYKQLLFEDR